MDVVWLIKTRLITACAVVALVGALANAFHMLTVRDIIRVVAVFAVGGLILGAAGWPMVSSQVPPATVTVFEGNVGISAAAVAIALAFAAGFAGWFVGWPDGRWAGILAAPAGLSIWALATGSVAGLLRSNWQAQGRAEIFLALRWEGFLWLAVVGAGLCGALAAEKLAGKGRAETNPPDKRGPGAILLNGLGGILVSVLAAQVVISLLAKNVEYVEPRVGAVVAQPLVGQIAFAVFVAFAVAAFLVKQLLDAGYLWPIIATAGLVFVVMSLAGRAEAAAYMSAQWPASFFVRAAASMVPLQVVGFGSVGAIAGYRAAVWRDSRKRFQAD